MKVVTQWSDTEIIKKCCFLIGFNMYFIFNIYVTMIHQQHRNFNTIDNLQGLIRHKQ